MPSLETPFAAGDSPVHRMDPRSRVLLAALFSVVTALADGFATLWTALGMALLLVLLARLPWAALLRRLLPVWGFLLLLWLVLPLTHAGAPAFSLGPLTATHEGLRLAGRITLKSNAILLALTAWVGTLDLITLGHSLNRLRCPERIVHLLLLTYRYVFVLEGEYQRLLRAAKIRGFKPGTNLHTYRTYAYLLGMLFVKASARAERVHLAMRCRGFKGRFHSLHRFRDSRENRIESGAMLAATIGLCLIEWMHLLPS